MAKFVSRRSKALAVALMALAAVLLYIWNRGWQTESAAAPADAMIVAEVQHAPAREPLGSSRSNPPSARTEFLVVDADGERPVANASVRLKGDHDVVELARTDSDGVTTSDAWPSGRVSVITSAAGFAPESHALDERPLRDVVRLVREDQLLVGEVVDVAGGRVSGAQVCCWPAGTVLTPELWLHAAEDSRVCGATTDESGAFRLHLKGDSTQWQIAAAARGLISTPDPGVVRAGASPHRLVVYPLFGGRLVFRDSDGGEVRASPRLKMRSRPTATVEAKHARWVARDWPSLVLLGLAADTLPEARSWTSTELFVCTAPEIPLELGPIQIDKRAVGYEPFLAVASLPRVVDGLEDVVFPLERIEAKWCELLVAISGPCAQLGSSTNALPAATVTLRRLSDGTEWGFAVDSLDDGTLEVGTMPADRYEYRWATTNRLHSSELRSVDLSADSSGAHVLLMDASELACIELELLATKGPTYNGPLVLQVDRLVNGLSQDTHFASFRESPYVLQGVPAGTYELRAKQPQTAATGSVTSVEVRAGQSARASLR
jgi:hypothetical protein